MTFPIRPSEQAEADRFFGALGRCIAKWSELEFKAGGLFWLVTRMPKDQAKSVFHSQRNWRAKTSLLKAAISSANLGVGLADAYMAIVERAFDYSQFRNAIAHDMLQFEPIWVARGGRLRALALRRHDASLEPIYDETALRRENLEVGAYNIDLLNAIISHALGRTPDDQLGSPERLSLLISFLPAHPHQQKTSEAARSQILLGIKDEVFPK